MLHRKESSENIFRRTGWTTHEEDPSPARTGTENVVCEPTATVELDHQNTTLSLYRRVAIDHVQFL